jgi:hypothetical protein
MPASMLTIFLGLKMAYVAFGKLAKMVNCVINVLDKQQKKTLKQRHSVRSI